MLVAVFFIRTTCVFSTKGGDLGHYLRFANSAARYSRGELCQEVMNDFSTARRGGDPYPLPLQRATVLLYCLQCSNGLVVAVVDRGPIRVCLRLMLPIRRQHKLTPTLPPNHYRIHFHFHVQNPFPLQYPLQAKCLFLNGLISYKWSY